MFDKLRLQDYFSIGYIYLLILGILKDSIYYKFLGINIIEYSSVSDVLLSPITYVAENITFALALIIVIFLSIKMPDWTKKAHFKSRDKKWYQKLTNVAKKDAHYAKKPHRASILIPVALGVAAFYLGAAMGSGNKRSKQLQNQELEMREVLTFSDQTQTEVRILGQNSEYLFYVIKGEDNITITPIKSNIRSIELLPEEVDGS